MPQIVKTLLGEHQVNVEDKLTGSYRLWDYCVQYQESSSDFISRLMELEGIAYHFRHEADKHTLVLTDAATQHQPFSGYEVIHHQTPSGSTDEEGISQWALEDSVTPGIYSLDDYDFRKPNAWLFQPSRTRRRRSRAALTCTTGRVALWTKVTGSSMPVSVRSAGRWSTSRFRPPPRRRDCARTHLHVNQRAVLQRQRGVSGDGGGLPLRGEPLRQRRGETIHRTDFTVIPSAVVYRPAQSTACRAPTARRPRRWWGRRGEYLDG